MTINETAGRSAGHGALDSAGLYAACRSADAQAQAAAYETLWHYLLRVALQMVYDQPQAEALAQDCAQVALIRVHGRMAECSAPEAFFAWARRIVVNATIDELRRLKRLVPLDEEDDDDEPATQLPAHVPPLETTALDRISLAELRAMIQRAPISARSARVVVGRYVDNQPDEILAKAESRLSARPVLPSHVQVTRTKDIAKLRAWAPLWEFLRSAQ
jgi:RNA polymerase sigma factor (sigma-70 family)